MLRLQHVPGGGHGSPVYLKRRGALVIFVSIGCAKFPNDLSRYP